MKTTEKKFIILLFSLLFFLPGFSMAAAVTLTALPSCIGSQAVVNLSWVSDITGSPTYDVLRKIQNQASFTLIKKVSNTNYQDNTINSDKNYVYQIKASQGTNSSQVLSPAAYCPPSLLSPVVFCQNDGPHITLSWTSVSGSLLNYEIYRDGVFRASTTNINFNEGPNIEGKKVYNYFIKAKWLGGVVSSSAVVPATAPACPPRLILSTKCLSVSPGGPQINLSWNSLLGVPEYEIYRKNPATTFSLLKKVTKTGYSDNLADGSFPGYALGGKISYFIRAKWLTDQQDSPSAEINIPRCQPFLKVDSVCIDSNPEMHLSWTKTEGAYQYNIYRDNKFQKQITNPDITASTDVLAITDCPLKSCAHTYRVEVFAGGLASALVSNSILKSINCSETSAPSPAPVLSKPSALCVGVDPQISLSWTSSNNVSNYKIYRDGLEIGTRIVNSYIDNGVQSGYSYTYRVSAFGEGGTRIDSPNSQTVFSVTCAPPSASTINSPLVNGCETGKPYVNISWTGTINTYFYEIWRGLSPTTLSFLTSFSASDPEFASTTWKDAGVSPSRTYYYQIISKGPVGGFSTPSTNKLSITTSLCSPTIPTLSLNTICLSGNPEVDLSWTTDAANTDHYEIFRNDRSLTVPIVPNLSASIKNWKDTNVFQKNTYQYRVEAVGYGSSPSRSVASASITTNNCFPPGPFTLSNPTTVCQGSYPRARFSWTNSADAVSYNFYTNLLNPDNSIAETAINYNSSSPYTDRGFGNALRFNGDDSVIIPNSSSLQTTGNLTVSFWAFPTDFSTRQNPVSKAYDGEFALTMETNGRLSYYQGSTLTGKYMSCSAAGIFSTNTWVNVTVVRNISTKTIQVYKNGVLQAISCSAWENPIASAAPLKIGDGYAGNFQGVIDEVRIYSRNLSSLEVIDQYNGIYSNESGLVGLWHFDEGSGQDLSDSSNYGNNGIMGSSPAWIKNGPQSEKRYNWKVKAMSFSGEIFSNTTAPALMPVCAPAKSGFTLKPLCQGTAPTVSISFSFSINAVKYEIYRQDKGLIKTVAQTASLSSRTITDSNVKTLTAYTYYIKTIGSTGMVTESDHLNVTTLGCLGPSQPQNLIANFSCLGSLPQVNLQWSPSANTDSYTIFRSPAGAPFPLSRTVTSYIDTAVSVNTPYNYSVIAYGLAGASSSSAPRSIATGYCRPSTPSITSLDTDCKTLPSVSFFNTISWSDPTIFNTRSYKIYRNTSNIIPSAAIATINSTSTAFSSRTWEDSSGLSALVTYYYWVKASGPAGDSTSSSRSITTLNCALTPGTPTNLKVDNYFCQGIIPYPTLSWTNSSNAYSYNIYRTNPDGSKSIYPTRFSPFTDKGSASLSFDGSNDYVSIPNSSSLQITGNLTISFWAYPTNIARGRQNPVAKAYGGEFALTMVTNGGLYYFHGSSGADKPPNMSCLAPGIFSNNTWVNVAVVRDVSDKTIKIYKNGVLQTISCEAWVNTSSSTNPLKIGDGYLTHPEGYFQGIIDEVRIYDRDLSSLEIANQYSAIYRNEAGLKAVLHFDEGTGSTVFDQSGNNNNGTLKNNPSWSVNSPVILKALPLENSKNYKYYVRAIGYDALSNQSNEITANKNCRPVSQNLILTSQCINGASQMKLSWSSDPNTAYWDVWKKRKGATISENVWKVYPPDTSWSDPSVLTGADYEYRLGAVNAGVVYYSNLATSNARFCFSSPSIPNITLSTRCVGNSSRILISWSTDPASNTVSYNLKEKNITTGITNSYTNLPASDVQYDSSVPDGNKYIYELEAVGSGPSNSSFSATSSKTSLECNKAAPGPMILSVNVPALPYAVSLKWTDAGNEDGYELFRNIDKGGPPSFDYSKPLTTFPASSVNIIYHTDNTVVDGEKYVYQVRAKNKNGESYSSILPVPVPIAGPKNFVLSGSWSAKKINLEWTSAYNTIAGGPVHYKIYRSSTASFDSSTLIYSGLKLNCDDKNPKISERYYRAEATNKGGTVFSDWISKYNLPTWEETAP